MSSTPTFPPLLTGHGVKLPERPFPIAIAGAEAGELGAGDLVWARNKDLLDFAVVMEPDVARARCHEMLFVMMVALGDSIGALAPPEMGVMFRWPNVILATGARVGEVRLAISEADGEDGCPVWIAAGPLVDIRPPPGAPEPGEVPDRTTLRDEGCIDIDRTTLLESASRHFLTWLNTWQEEGFRPVHENFESRLEETDAVSLQCNGEVVSGTRLGLDEQGGLLVKQGDATRLVTTMEALPPWS